MEIIFSRLIERISNLESVVQRQQVRINNMFREGEVKSVDPMTGLAIVDAHGVESKPSPWLSQAGDINEWTPLSEKQRVVLVSPSGDLGRSFIIPGGFTDQVPAPHDQLAQKRVEIGGAVITHSAAGFVITVDGLTFSITAEGVFTTVGGVTHRITGAGTLTTGGQVIHNEKSIGDTHGHVSAPPGAPGPPV